jgi:hypothetical protein
MLKKYFVMSIFLLLTACDSATPPKEDVFPWQVTVQANGRTRVFGIVIKETSVIQAARLLGSGYKIALFENDNQTLSLEAFVQDVTLAGLSAKIVLAIESDEDQKRHYRDRAKKREPLGNGVIRYSLSAEDAQDAANRKVDAISYIPYVNLDEAMILSRFGEPAKRITVNKNQEHFLYPESGLDLLMDKEGKELLQYVVPAEFDRLMDPLKQVIDKDKKN